METVNLSTELVNAILQYMASRPYGEVFQLVAAIQAQAVVQAHPQAFEEAKPAE
jgi:hypothetical protein